MSGGFVNKPSTHSMSQRLLMLAFVMLASCMATRNADHADEMRTQSLQQQCHNLDATTTTATAAWIGCTSASQFLTGVNRASGTTADPLSLLTQARCCNIQGTTTTGSAT